LPSFNCQETFQMKSYLRITGFTILGISCVLFLLIPVVPFMGFPAAKTAGIAAGLLIAGEITFYLSIFILGRSLWEKLKSRFSFPGKKKKETGLSTDSK